MGQGNYIGAALFLSKFLGILGGCSLVIRVYQIDLKILEGIGPFSFSDTHEADLLACLFYDCGSYAATGTLGTI